MLLESPVVALTAVARVIAGRGGNGGQIFESSFRVQ
jgi:hypothetical protein